jgi:hypothetical protein
MNVCNVPGILSLVCAHDGEEVIALQELTHSGVPKSIDDKINER